MYKFFVYVIFAYWHRSSQTVQYDCGLFGNGMLTVVNMPVRCIYVDVCVFLLLYAYMRACACLCAPVCVYVLAVGMQSCMFYYNYNHKQVWPCTCCSLLMYTLTPSHNQSHMCMYMRALTYKNKTCMYTHNAVACIYDIYVYMYHRYVCVSLQIRIVTHTDTQPSILYILRRSRRFEVSPFSYVYTCTEMNIYIECKKSELA